MTKIAVFAIERSGHNAIQTWLLLKFGKAKPRKSTHDFTVDNVCFRCNVQSDGESYQPGSGFGDEDKCDFVLYEMKHPNLSEGLGWLPDDFVPVVVVRDPWNLIASRRRNGAGWDFDWSDWIDHAEYLLPASRPKHPSVVPINFNRWSCDKWYRFALSKRLGVPLEDDGSRIATAPDGFEDCVERGSANGHYLNVLDRWQHYRDDQGYLKQLSQPACELAETIWGWNPLG